jgi:queuine tRNA-ribosyltransferase
MDLPLRFEITQRAHRARCGVIHTPNGSFETPAFTPVGTKANVKGVLPHMLAEMGAQVVLANTYHLYLQPGEQVVKDAGGLASFMNWKGPTITDSGGFQVFSLGAAFGKNITKVAKGEENTNTLDVSVYDEAVQSQHGQLAIIDEEGVTFTSHLDGSLHRFTPERSVEIQHALGADIFFAFDECTAPTETLEYQRDAMRRTHAWAIRSIQAHRQNIEAKKRQAIFGIVQGGPFPELRKQSAYEISQMGFDGYGIGGSFTKADMGEVLASALEFLEDEKPRHYLGIGEPGDILLGVAQGIDMFDCVMPTRIGRHGTIFTLNGPIHLTNEKYIRDFSLLDEDLYTPDTPAFLKVSKAYVAHLLRAKEMNGQILASAHNTYFIQRLMQNIRTSIKERRFEQFSQEFMSRYYNR